VFAENGVSIETVRQHQVPEPEGQSASLVVVTHSATDRALAATVAALARLEVVSAVVGVMRVEGEE
jgi:homoserine dehydrogenase